MPILKMKEERKRKAQRDEVSFTLSTQSSELTSHVCPQEKGLQSGRDIMHFQATTYPKLRDLVCYGQVITQINHQHLSQKKVSSSSEVRLRQEPEVRVLSRAHMYAELEDIHENTIKRRVRM